MVVATNRKLEEEVKHGKFREDLYDRLNVLPIEIPLRCAPCGGHPQARALLHRAATTRSSAARPPRSPDTERLQAYGWPGNIRELRNAIERAMLLVDGDESTNATFR